MSPGYVPTGPWTAGSAPGVSAAFLTNLEAFVQQLEGDTGVTTITGGKNSWDVNVASAPSLKLAPFQTLDAYAQWKSQIAQPAFQQYFANKIDLATVGTQLIDGWTKVGGK